MEQLKENKHMKKIFLVLLGAMMFCTMRAQVVEQDEAAIVYYSPKTSVTLTFSYTVETYERGIYAAFAETMLGLTDAVKETKTTYHLDRVQIGTATTTDYNRPHKVVAEPGFPMLLSINDRGLLVGYNMPIPEAKPATPPHRPTPPAPHADVENIIPLPEEVLNASGTLAQARAAAKQIFHIRETRMYLINGEVEHAPADGQAMQLVLAELDKQEQALLALFAGSKSTRKETKRVQFVPEEEEPVWFFSEENGFTDAENVEAESITVNLSVQKQQLAAPQADPKKKKTAPAVSQLVYNLPGTCVVTVQYKGHEMAERTLQIAQFGVDVPLAKDLFSGAALPTIVFSEKTGNILSISK